MRNSTEIESLKKYQAETVKVKNVLKQIHIKAQTTTNSQSDHGEQEKSWWPHNSIFQYILHIYHKQNKGKT